MVSFRQRRTLERDAICSETLQCSASQDPTAGIVHAGSAGVAGVGSEICASVDQCPRPGPAGLRLEIPGSLVPLLAAYFVVVRLSHRLPAA